MPDVCPLCIAQGDTIAAPRHVAGWNDLTVAEQFGLLARMGEALAAGALGFAASAEHGHFHLRAPSASDQSNLTTGGGNPLFPVLARRIDGASRVDLAIAFAMDSGVRLIEPWLRDLLARGGQLRLVVGDYMDVTEPAALWRLSDLEGASLRVFETGAGSFHPKAWLFRAADRSGAAIVGSSNLSATALTSGVEWNLHSESAADKVEIAFEALLAHPQTKPLTPDWITRYVARRKSATLPKFAQKVVADEAPTLPPLPHHIQEAALEALRKTRAEGYAAGLVVLATGLGKTWLAAFDSRSYARVLFVAHREEILTQAMASFRRIRPEAQFGRYDGTEKDGSADILFASIQTLGREGHLRRFAPDAFDYIVVDEFHHAAAASYRGLLEHFTPQFLLGLTATPDRSDRADLLALCGDNLVYQRDLFEGIDDRLLSPFRYLGVPDEVDYEQIPWRSSRFDPEALEAALATETRAANALDQFKRHREGPAIGFCCSLRHADFMAQYFRERGFRAVAVHSGPDSAPRSTSLDQLGRGEIDILFAVDMFNEGVDVPQIGTVMMLRPTESAIIWLQQLGRGLRRVEGKVLRVIDYIGNHRIFLMKLRALLTAGPGDRSLALKLDQIIDGTLSLPVGCSVTYELKVIEILRDLLRPKNASDDLEAQYRDFRMRHGIRPTAAEIGRMGFDPARNGHGGWFDFVRDMGDPVESRVLSTHGRFLRQIERDAALTAPSLSAVVASLSGRLYTPESLEAWALSPFFRRDGDRLVLTRPDTTGALVGMVEELADWRIGTLRAPICEASEDAAKFQEAPTLWREYMREGIPPLFGAVFNPGNWNSGIVRLKRDLILLTTLQKGNLSVGGHYEDSFLSPTRMQWQSQNQTTRESLVGRILNGAADGYRVHLFVRNGKLRNGKAAPFLNCGNPLFKGWEGEQPITVTWEFTEAVPVHLRKSLGVPS